MAKWPALIPSFDRSGPVIRPSLFLFFWLTGAFLLTLAPHIEQFPLWVTTIILLAMGLRCVWEVYRLPLPSTTFCAILAVCLLAGVYLQFHTIFGRDAGTSFMAGLLAIKFYEWRGPRDIALIIFSSFFVVMSALLYSQALELFIYCLIMMWVLTGILLRVHMGDTADNRLLAMLGRSFFIFSQAVPLTLLLFFFFPRFTGKLQLGLDDTSIGVTDHVEPGSISRLANDDSTAMYVHFSKDDALPGLNAMYWRGLVLWHYDKGVWTQEAANPRTREMSPALERLPAPAPHSTQVTQNIIISPHYQRWLFALDYPTSRAESASESNWTCISVSGGALQLSESTSRINHKESYTVTSFSDLDEETLADPLRKKGLQLPENEISPRVRELADRLYRANPNPKEFIVSIFRYFRSEHFVYTDSPGKMGKDPLDEFLFVRKAGFCEHFASAFAVLMRLEHCPARMVVGYRGAQYNPYGDFYTVKQSNAHAWDEVWIDSERRWVRCDPTMALAAGEVEMPTSGNSGTSTEEGLSIQVAHHRFTFLSSTYVPNWMREGLLEFQLRRQQIEADWDDWVFSYDAETQDTLMQALAFKQGTRSALVALCLATGLVIGLVLLRRFIKRKPRPAPVENFYALFCRNMAQRGMPRAIWEGPVAYTDRVAEVFPEKKKAIHDVGWIVARSRYGPTTEEEDPEKLKELLLLIGASQAASSSRERESS